MNTIMLILSFALLACGFSGCADKNYSKKKPDERELQGTWALDQESREAVEKNYHLKLSGKGGVIEVRSDGTFAANEFPVMGAHSKPGLLGGQGKWSLQTYGEVWRLQLAFEDASGTTIIPVDIGHDAGKTFLNQAIDDPDGPVMRFYRVEPSGH